MADPFAVCLWPKCPTEPPAGELFCTAHAPHVPVELVERLRTALRTRAIGAWRAALRALDVVVSQLPP